MGGVVLWILWISPPDFKATLTDGAYHDVDSSSLAFEIAARAAFREGVAKCGPVLLEPMMKVEVITPEEYMGDVIGDLNSRRGQVQGMGDQPGGAQVVDATVPLASMFGYVNMLRTKTKGRATYSMVFDHYAPVPHQTAGKFDQKHIEIFKRTLMLMLGKIGIQRVCRTWRRKSISGRNRIVILAPLVTLTTARRL